MDTSAYLRRHGWRGKGYALHPTGRGITKPLLVSKKNNVLGVGKKINDTHGDQWWAKAFDSGLKNLTINNLQDSDTKVDPSSKSPNSLKSLRKRRGKWDGLYSAFVKGDGLKGTLDASSSCITATGLLLSDEIPTKASDGIIISPQHDSTGQLQNRNKQATSPERKQKQRWHKSGDSLTPTTTGAYEVTNSKTVQKTSQETEPKKESKEKTPGKTRRPQYNRIQKGGSKPVQPKDAFLSPDLLLSTLCSNNLVTHLEHDETCELRATSILVQAEASSVSKNTQKLERKGRRRKGPRGSK